MEEEQRFFDFAAELGLTKHIGNVEATEELAGLCKISEGKYILDVGCGVGVTACYLAKVYGCRVVGVDILPKMVERSRQRANKEKITDQVEFRVADAQSLPFEDNKFDAVITESMTAFPEDKQKAVDEYARVTKPGGYVGLNESTWLQFPPPQEVAAWASQEIGATVNPLTPDGWKELLVNAGLIDIVVRTSPVDTQTETKGILKRYGFTGILGTLIRALRLYMRNPAYRQFLKRLRQTGITPPNLEAYFGYGIYVGRKERTGESDL
jgi:ubiquinone/menaquinone biosynthesis C-methylase UbiE